MRLLFAKKMCNVFLLFGIELQTEAAQAPSLSCPNSGYPGLATPLDRGRKKGGGIAQDDTFSQLMIRLCIMGLCLLGLSPFFRPQATVITSYRDHH